MKNFTELNRKDGILFLEVNVGADEKRCFLEAREFLITLKEVRFYFNGRAICLNEGNFSEIAKNEGLNV